MVVVGKKLKKATQSLKTLAACWRERSIKFQHNHADGGDCIVFNESQGAGLSHMQWLAEVNRASPPFSPRAARVALQGRVASDFSTERIDPRLYANRRLTPVGLWHVDPKHPKFGTMDRTIRAIRERILLEPNLKIVTAAEIAAETGLTERQVGEALFAAGDLSPRFFTQANGVAAIRWPTGNSTYPMRTTRMMNT